MSDAQQQPKTNKTFLQSARRVWFTLEHLRRSNNDEDLETKLQSLSDQPDRMIDWKNLEVWGSFVQDWDGHVATVFGEPSSDQERAILDAFQTHRSFCESLPNRPDSIADESITLQSTHKHLKELLQQVDTQYGEAMAPCSACGKCAFGRKLLACSRCRSARYCSKDCQVGHWKVHKQLPCKPMDKLTSKQLDERVRQRFYEWRRLGQDSQTAMQKARHEFGLDQKDAQADVGSQVAAMFGMM